MHNDYLYRFSYKSCFVRNNTLIILKTKLSGGLSQKSTVDSRLPPIFQIFPIFPISENAEAVQRCLTLYWSVRVWLHRKKCNKPVVKTLFFKDTVLYSIKTWKSIPHNFTILEIWRFSGSWPCSSLKWIVAGEIRKISKSPSRVYVHRQCCTRVHM